MIQVAAQQYYSIAEIILTLTYQIRSGGQLGEGASQAKRDLAQYHALQVCGLAYTNDNVAARVNAFGPLAFCAYTSFEMPRGRFSSLSAASTAE
jgi:hypothetical protein